MVLLFSIFYNFSENFTIFNKKVLLLLITAVLRKGIQTSSVFARYFYSLRNPIVLIYPFYLTGMLAWKMLKKVHRNELNIWLGSVSI